MRQRINIIVTCTKRKHLPPAPELRLRDVRAADIGKGFTSWIQRLSASKSRTVPARDMYAGEYWSVVRTLEDIASTSGFEASIWVCSAGYGLIAMEAEVKPYSATFSPNHADTVCRWSGANATGAGKLWWRLHTERNGLDSGQPRSIKDVATKYPDSPLLVVASQPYLRAISDDVSVAAKNLNDVELLCIISAGTSSLPGSETNLLPCNATLRAREGGSLNSLNVRLARTILAQIRGETLRSSTLRPYFAAWVAAAPPLQKYGRTVMTNDQVKEYVKDSLDKDPKITWTVLLRRLRQSGQACSQERFSSFFQAVKNRAGTKC